MAGRGRPTTLTEEHKTRALTFAAMGWSNRACARAAGVSWMTFSGWLAKNPEFAADLTRASMDCGAVATDSLMQACRNGEQWAVTFLLSRPLTSMRREVRHFDVNGRRDVDGVGSRLARGGS